MKLFYISEDSLYCHIANDNISYPMNYFCNEVVLAVLQIFNTAHANV